MARKFLYIVAGLVVLVLAVLLALRLFADELTELTMVPDGEFEAQPALEANSYHDPKMWIARPGLGAGDPSQWQPEGFEEDADALAVPVFFVHPTSYLDKAFWNAPVDEPESRTRAEMFVRGMASPFNKSVDIWAPRYRQAAVGAFLTEKPEADQALDLAYKDVAQAFDFFIETVARDKPIVLAGHSQGSFHLRRLIAEKIAGTPLQDRVAVAYLAGWPISLVHDLPKMGLPPCTAPDQAGCIASWQTFAEPADTAMVIKGYERKLGLDGQSVAGSAFLCVNPLTGTEGGEAPASANLGTLVPDWENDSGTLARGVVPARCGEDGFLYIGAPPTLELGPYALPGNNYHVYDMTMFWANLREDMKRRVAAWKPAE
ncbi:MAG: DUF3089 domain-containing protein [Sphingomonadaceae bacterium]